MSFDFPKWISKYDDVAPDESIEYRDNSGAWKEEKDYRFGSISAQFQQRGRIHRDELRKIGRWKAGGRVDHHLKQNNPTFVEQRSSVAFQATGNEKKIEALTELKGVSVPVASTILTMFDPTNHAVVDYRAFRALGAAKPQLLVTQNYAHYTEFMNHFQNYNTNPSAYAFYIDEVQDIARQEGLLPREVDMALWAYDKSMT